MRIHRNCTTEERKKEPMDYTKPAIENLGDAATLIQSFPDPNYKITGPLEGSGIPGHNGIMPAYDLDD